MSSDLVDYGSLSALERLAGGAVSFGLALGGLWLSAPPAWLPRQLFSQARQAIAFVNGAVFAGVFIFCGNSRSLPVLALAALVGLSVGLLCLLVLARIRTTTLRHDSAQSAATLWLGTFMGVAVSGGFCLASASVILMVWYGNPANLKTVHLETPARTPAMTYDIGVALTGVRRTAKPGSATPFQVSSGQVNFSCEEIKSVAVTLPLPSDARLQGEPTAQWINLANARASSASTRLGTEQLVADGMIQGLDWQRLGFLRNCLGSGHGELVLAGSYVTNATALIPYDTLLNARVDRLLSVAHLTLPSPADVALASATVVFTDASTHCEVYRTKLDFKAGRAQRRRSCRGRFEVSTAADDLVIQFTEP